MLDIHNAQTALAWPIARYSYLVMRKSTKGPGATCAHVRRAVAFWHCRCQSSRFSVHDLSGAFGELSREGDAG